MWVVWPGLSGARALVVAWLVRGCIVALRSSPRDADLQTRTTAALWIAASGAEIVIQPGQYAENLTVIDKDLMLRNGGLVDH